MKDKRKVHIDEQRVERSYVIPRTPTRTLNGRSPTKALAVSNDRFTYTLIFNNDVISIHYDRLRSEIFFKGHNLRYLRINDDTKKALIDVMSVLYEDEEGRSFARGYKATLDRLLTDN